MYSKFGVKELYEVSLKTTDNMTINGQNYEADEVVMFFEKLQIATITPDTSVKEASGGKDNFSWILWDKISGVDFTFEDGLLNYPGFNFLSQSRMTNSSAIPVTIPKRESIVTNATGKAILQESPTTSRAYFAYKVSGDIITEKMTILSINSNIVDLGVGNASTNVLIDYYFTDTGTTYYEIGGENITGFLKMTSKINLTDEKDGMRTTALFVLPKVRILSNLSLTFGVRASPIVSTFRVRAFPDSDGKTLARFIYLNQDIEG